ncbi:sensor histidine kinase [Pseudoflavonifractor sp. MSJ-37]|uniref:sensor histidine kinase n=1 Tax=Pseudoflavonifractor sp. MSJ-37 TaxID=2841531 RepID=UPI001C1012FA|nr:sensor histidine kinase [Pseudoflavonifractor sp. MSJ-37]MBU5434002.1 sensor histidine kinase [Pseudoflavonifractor sp. MSJ-37]
MSLSRPSIRAQLMRLSLIIVLSSLVIALTGTLYLTLRSERHAMDNSLLNSASILSQVPLVRETLEEGAPAEDLTDFLDQTTSHVSDIDLILICGKDDTIYYAPDAKDIGTAYTGTAQADILAGAGPYTSNETGPMGSDHSAYAPVHGTDGELIGYVLVGIYTRSMTALTLSTVIRFVGMGLIAAVLASLLALRLSKSIKESLMGYEPEVLTRRFLQREDILEALEEGVMAIDKEKNIIFLNASAAQMLSLDQKTAVGQPLHTVYPRSTLDRILRTGRAEYNVSMSSLKDVRVLADRLPLYENGKLAGAVGIFRNRTEVTQLADDLTGVRHMVEAMRAYTHEFMNKLHVILGLLQIGEPEKAQEYIMDISRTQQQAVRRIMVQIREPSVAALLVGKTSRANELGIRLTLDRESALREDSPWLSPDAYVTLLGNLIENAIESLDRSARENKEIAVSIRESDDALLLCVEDTGPGIPVDLRGKLFQRGISSKGSGRGTGLALVREIVDAYRGEIRVESESGVGTSFFLTFHREDDAKTEKEWIPFVSSRDRRG